MSLSSDSLVLQHQKDVCCCIYHQAFCLDQLLFFCFFLPFWGICFVVLHWLVLLFSDSFLEIKLNGKHKLVNMSCLICFHYYSVVASSIHVL